MGMRPATPLHSTKSINQSRRYKDSHSSCDAERHLACYPEPELARAFSPSVAAVSRCIILELVARKSSRRSRDGHAELVVLFAVALARKLAVSHVARRKSS